MSMQLLKPIDYPAVEKLFQSFEDQFNPFKDFATLSKTRLIWNEKQKALEEMDRVIGRLPRQNKLEKSIKAAWQGFKERLQEIPNVEKVEQIGKYYLLFHHFMHAWLIHKEIPLTHAFYANPWGLEHLLYPWRTHCEHLFRDQEESMEEERGVARRSSNPLIRLENAFHHFSSRCNPFTDFAKEKRAKRIVRNFATEIQALDSAVRFLPHKWNLIQKIWGEVYGPLSNRKADFIQLRKAAENYLLLTHLVRALFASTFTPLSGSFNQPIQGLSDGHPLGRLLPHFKAAFPADLLSIDSEEEMDETIPEDQQVTQPDQTKLAEILLLLGVRPPEKGDE